MPRRTEHLDADDLELSHLEIRGPRDDGGYDVLAHLVAAPEWRVRLTLRAGVVSSFALEPVGELPANGLTTRLLRSIPLGTLQERARRRLAMAAGQARRRPLEREVQRAREIDVALRPGRAGRSDLEYARIAAVYVSLLEEGDATATKTLATRLGYSASQIRNFLYEARSRLLLTAAPRGRQGGTLTEKARQLLEAEHGKR